MKNTLLTMTVTTLMLAAVQALAATLGPDKALDIAESLRPAKYVSVELLAEEEVYLLTGIAQGEPVEVWLDASNGHQLPAQKFHVDVDFEVDIRRAIREASRRSDGELISIDFFDDERPVYIALFREGDKMTTLELDAESFKVIRSETFEDMEVWDDCYRDAFVDSGTSYVI